MKRVLLNGLLGCMLVSQSAYASNPAYLKPLKRFNLIGGTIQFMGGVLAGLVPVALIAEKTQRSDATLITGITVAGIALYFANQEKKSKNIAFPMAVALGAASTGAILFGTTSPELFK